MEEEEGWRLEEEGWRDRGGASEREGWEGEGEEGGEAPPPVSLPRRWRSQHGRGVRTGRLSIGLIQTMINLGIKMRNFSPAARMARPDEHKDSRESN